MPRDVARLAFVLLLAQAVFAQQPSPTPHGKQDSGQRWQGMKRLAAMVILMMSATAAAQDIKHAPTVAQCQADQRVWMEQVEDQAIVDTISYTTLRQWGLEMKDCQHVDPQFEFRYHNACC